MRGAFCAVTAAIVLTTAPVPGQSDDFTDGNDQQWTRYDPVAIALGQTSSQLGNTWTFPNGGYQISAAASPNPTAAGPARLGSLREDASYSRFCLAVDIGPGWDAKPDQAFGFLARIQPGFGPGQTNGYAFSYQTQGQDVQISLLTGEVPTEVAPPVDVTLDPAKSYRFVFMGDGSQLEGRIYELDDLLNPVVIASGTDNSHAQGIAGLVVYDNGGDQGAVATFDNYHASALVPPDLQITASSLEAIVLSWPAPPLCFKLQSSTTLLANDWQDVPAGLIIYTDDMFFLQENRAGIQRKFFRLVSLLPAVPSPLPP
jgi:hypothetical protein